MKLDRLLTSGVMITGDIARPRAHQVGIWKGKIVGVDEQVAGMEAHEVINLDGATVTAGFHDAHCHTAWFGLGLRSVDLSGIRSVGELQGAITRKAQQLPRGGWLQGVGLDQNTLGRYPHRSELDAAAPEHQVVLRHSSGHAMVVGTSTLRLAGLMNASTVDPVGGVIVRDEDGLPTGLLEEQAQQLVQAFVLPYSTEDLVGAIDAAGLAYLSQGITSITEAGIGGGWIGHSPTEVHAYQTARGRGMLRTRTNLMVASDVLHPLRGHNADSAKFGLDLGLRTGFGDDMLRLAAVKIFTDGSLIGRTALMTEPFCGHGGHGYLQRSKHSTHTLVRDAHQAGWQVAIHAIGDGAVDLALDAIEQAQASSPRPDARPRIEHAGIVRPDQIRRMAQLEVIAVTQPNFISSFGDVMAKAIGDSRIGWAYRHASLVDAGIKVAASSDRPVAPGSPLQAIQAMVERLTESGTPFGDHERVPVETALASYTSAGAYATHQEERLGVIKAGQLADIVVLDQDPTSIASSRIGGIEVLGTMLDGQFRYLTGRLKTVVDASTRQETLVPR